MNQLGVVVKKTEKKKVLAKEKIVFGAKDERISNIRRYLNDMRCQYEVEERSGRYTQEETVELEHNINLLNNAIEALTEN